MLLGKYSIGVGDRFGRQGVAQLAAVRLAAERGCQVVPVWNKSFREHSIVGSAPADVRAEAEHAVAVSGWTGGYHVDADHIGMSNVEGFIESSDFFTLDVAEFIGRTADPADVAGFVDDMRPYTGRLRIPGLAEEIALTQERVADIGRKFLLAVQKAGALYRHIASRRARDSFIVEVSMDETDSPQSPAEMFFILAMAAREEIPAQTIAPKFTGRFNKGVDYVGDPAAFEAEFNADLLAVRYAVREFGLPSNLKLSVHSGSDKFSLYPLMRRTLRRHAAGLHLKTAGTTWLEELAGLAESGPEGLRLAVEIYEAAYSRFDELCAPYASVVSIDPARMPPPKDVALWDGAGFAAALRHDASCPAYNLHFRQFLHVAYKVAAERRERYLEVLDRNSGAVGRRVTENLFNRHLEPLFLAG
jgi:hypothetical protein